MAGSAVMREAWSGDVAAILMLWYPGMAGGAALADVLFGRVNPSGRLPFSVPRRAEDLPFFDRDASQIRYDLWHGYTKLERDGVAPSFPFGFGLSYTRFAFDRAQAEPTRDDGLRVEVDVVNEGSRDGACVVQVYAGMAEPAEEQPRKRLCAFTRVELAAGERRRVAIDVALRDLAWFDATVGHWRLGARDWRLRVGGSSADADTLPIDVSLPERTYTIRER